MTKFHAAVSVSILLLGISSTSVAQSFKYNCGAPEARTVDAPISAPSPDMAPIQQSPADSSVIVVRPELTTEQLADIYMARKDYREAAQTYKRLTEENPRNPVYLNKLGIALHQQTALTLALKYYERATRVDPTYADAQNNIGTIWYQRKKYGKAVRSYQKAINIRKDMPVLYSNLGYAYFGEKKYDQAIKSFHQALTLDPQFFEHSSGRNGSVLQDRSVTDRGRFYYMLAKSFAQSGNLDRCVIYLRKAKDENYPALMDAKTDPDFAQMLKNPAIQEILVPKAIESAQN